MYNIRGFLNFCSAKGHPSFNAIKKHSGVIYKTFTDMCFTKDELQEIANRGNSAGPIGILNAVGDLRKDRDEEAKYNTCLYIMAGEYVNPLSVLPRPSKGQCSRCMFNSRCRSVFTIRHNGCHHFVANNAEAFSLRIGSEVIVYDRGIYAAVNPSTKLPISEPVVGNPAELLKDKYIDSSECIICGSFVIPINKPLLRYGVRPHKGEDYQSYAARVDAIVAKIEESLKTDEDSPKASDKDVVKNIFIMLGHEQVLRDTFAGDVVRMAQVFFPGKTLQNIALQFSGAKKKAKVTTHDVYGVLKKGDSYGS